MLEYLNPEAKKPSAVSIFTKPGCPFCARAKQLLLDKGMRFEEVVLGQDATSITLKAMSGRTTVPQVFIDGRHIGGSDELVDYLA
nr:glutaredoxin domain-containing protein [Zobellella maritima]